MRRIGWVGLAVVALTAVLFAQGTIRHRGDVDITGDLTVGGTDVDLPNDVIDASELHTATGTSTGTGERTIAVQALSFWPEVSGDPLCSLIGTFEGWTIRTSRPARWGEFVLPGAVSPSGITTAGSNLWVTEGQADIWRLSQSDPSMGTEFNLPTGVGNNVRGVTASGSNFWVLDNTTPRSVWRVPQSDPTAGTEFTLPALVQGFGGIAAVGSDLWIAEISTTGSVWRVPQSDPTTGTEFSYPSGVSGNIFGLAASGSNLWLLSGTTDTVWRVQQSDPTTGVELDLPAGVGDLVGITAQGPDLWMVDNTNPRSVWRVPQANPAISDCGGGSSTNTLEWEYMTGSDNPAVWVRRTAAGEAVELWQAEDAPAAAPISIPFWQTTTDTVVSAGPPPTAILTGLYAGASTTTRQAALASLRGYTTGRGWLGTLNAVGDVENVPRAGCGTPTGDCRPAARLWALRALAEAGGETVFAVVARELRVDAAGAWSAAP